MQFPEAVAGLRHPNIVQVYDGGDYEGRPFFTMEYVEGGTVAEKLAGNSGCDTVSRHVGQHLVSELRRIRATLTHQVTVDPLLGDSFELPEQMKLGVFAGVTPTVQDKV